LESYLQGTIAKYWSMGYNVAAHSVIALGRYWRRIRLIVRMQGYRALARAVHRHLTSKQVFARPNTVLLAPSDLPGVLAFPVFSDVSVSVVVHAQGRIDVAHLCLASLLKHSTKYPFEVIVAFECCVQNCGATSPVWRNVRIIEPSDLAGFDDSRNVAAASARGAYVVFLSDATQVQEGWLDALIDTFARKADAGLVGCRVLFADGRQREAGALVWRDGSYAHYGYRDDPYRPEYSYLRRADYCSSVALAVRSAVFHEVHGFSTEWGRSPLGSIDFAFRAKRAGYEAYYQPNARVVCVSVDEVCDAENVERSQHKDAMAARRRFVEKWQVLLRGHGGPSVHANSEIERDVSIRVLVVDYALPAADRDSGSLRMFNLLLLLLEQGFKVTFASVGLEARQPYLSKLQGVGVECLYKPYEHSIQAHLRRRGGVYDLVILSRFDTAAELQDAARRWCRRAKIVFDTVDLHFQRLAREAEVRGDARLQRLASRKRSEELRLMVDADMTLVVSEVERAYVVNAARTATVRVLSNIHEVKGCQAPFAARRDILFIGGFGHPPNADAVQFFCDAVFPRVQAQVPDARLLVIGAEPPPDILRLASDRVKILGHVPVLEHYLNTCRLSVAPLRFGAGVKGKINQSLAYGLPVVATTVAVEGMFLEQGQSVLVADDPKAFADAVVKLYRDESLWQQLSRGGVVVAEEHFSFNAARAAVAGLLSVLEKG
jgi:glycosyltransferase involved in cell wall biosynthesis